MFPAVRQASIDRLEQRFLRRCSLLGKNHVVPRWIFHAAFARTMGCANVRGVMTKALVISSVVSPHTSRKVSATRASGARDG
jgi:hypothetical protein